MIFRRNRTELLLSLLQAVSAGPLAKTRAMGLCNTCSATFDPLLKRSIDLKLVERHYGKIEITELGKKALTLYDDLNDLLKIEHRLGGSLWSG